MQRGALEGCQVSKAGVEGCGMSPLRGAVLLRTDEEFVFALWCDTIVANQKPGGTFLSLYTLLRISLKLHKTYRIELNLTTTIF